MEQDRRQFLHRMGGALLAAGIPAVAGCPGVGKVIPASCPASRPACRVLATRYKYPADSEPRLWVTTRELASSGTWSAMAPADFLSGNGSFNIWDVDEVSVPRGRVSGPRGAASDPRPSPFACRESHVLIVGTPRSPDWWELLYLRQRANGTWASTVSLSYGIGDWNTQLPVYAFETVSAARVGTALHVCGSTASGWGNQSYFPAGRVLHGVRSISLDDEGYETGAWQARWKDVTTPSSGLSRPVVDVGCAGVANQSTGREDLHACVVTDDGRLWHCIHDVGASTWTPFGDVGIQAGSTSRFRRVDAASEGNQLHVVAVTDTGRVLYTIRGANSWRPFEDVVAAASSGNGLPAKNFTALNVSASMCSGGLPSGQWQLYIVASNGSRLAYTIHSRQPAVWAGLPQGASSVWKPWVDLLEETGGGGEGGEFGNEHLGFSVAECELP